MKLRLSKKITSSKKFFLLANSTQSSLVIFLRSQIKAKFTLIEIRLEFRKNKKMSLIRKKKNLKKLKDELHLSICI